VKQKFYTSYLRQNFKSNTKLYLFRFITNNLKVKIFSLKDYFQILHNIEFLGLDFISEDRYICKLTKVTESLASKNQRMRQAKALSIMIAGKNTFLTGSAGAGKTYTLNQYIRYLRVRKIPVAVTASTGIASTHINGMTIHAWAGIGLKKSLTKSDLLAISEKKHIRDQLEKTKMLIIDEISMLHRNQLDAVNEVLQFIRQNSLPFGGIQVIFCGDFFQLPPVGDAEESNREKFAFMSDAWVKAAPVICYLTEQHRQKGDNLDKILNDIRSGDVDENSLQLLRIASKNNLFAVPKLYTHNIDVERINAAEMAKLEGKKMCFSADKKGNPKLLEMLMYKVRTDNQLE